MSGLLNSSESLCDRFQAWLERSPVTATRSPGTALETPQGFLSDAPLELREHAALCADCRDAASDVVTIRNLLRDVEAAPVAGPWFAPRVMATIASQEAELSRSASIWLAVPRFASRLSWVAAATLLVACTWLYERPVKPPPAQSASAFATEHLFDPPALPPNHDDVLVSLNEKDQ